MKYYREKNHPRKGGGENRDLRLGRRYELVKAHRREEARRGWEGRNDLIGRAFLKKARRRKEGGFRAQNLKLSKSGKGRGRGLQPSLSGEVEMDDLPGKGSPKKSEPIGKER